MSGTAAGDDPDAAASTSSPSLADPRAAGAAMPRREASLFACTATRVVFAVIALSAATFVSLAIVLHSAPHHRGGVAGALPWQVDPKRAARVQRAVASHPQGPPEFPMDGALAGAGATVLHHDSMRATLRRCLHGGALAPRGLRFLVLTPTDCKAVAASGALPGWLAHPLRPYDVFLMDHSPNNSCAGFVAGGARAGAAAAAGAASDDGSAAPPLHAAAGDETSPPPLQQPLIDDAEAALHSKGSVHPSDWGVEAVFSRPGRFKYPGIHSVFAAVPGLLDRYDYVAFTDDDISFAGADGGAAVLESAFRYVAAAGAAGGAARMVHQPRRVLPLARVLSVPVPVPPPPGLWIGQPSLSPESSVGVGVTRHVETVEVVGAGNRPTDASCSAKVLKRVGAGGNPRVAAVPIVAVGSDAGAGGAKPAPGAANDPGKKPQAPPGKRRPRSLSRSASGDASPDAGAGNRADRAPSGAADGAEDGGEPAFEAEVPGPDEDSGSADGRGRPASSRVDRFPSPSSPKLRDAGKRSGDSSSSAAEDRDDSKAASKRGSAKESAGGAQERSSSKKGRDGDAGDADADGGRAGRSKDKSSSSSSRGGASSKGEEEAEKGDRRSARADSGSSSSSSKRGSKRGDSEREGAEDSSARSRRSKEGRGDEKDSAPDKRSKDDRGDQQKEDVGSGRHSKRDVERDVAEADSQHSKKTDDRVSAGADAPEPKRSSRSEPGDGKQAAAEPQPEGAEGDAPRKRVRRRGSSDESANTPGGDPSPASAGDASTAAGARGGGEPPDPSVEAEVAALSKRAAAAWPEAPSGAAAASGGGGDDADAPPEPYSGTDAAAAGAGQGVPASGLGLPEAGGRRLLQAGQGVPASGLGLPEAGGRRLLQAAAPAADGDGGAGGGDGPAEDEVPAPPAYSGGAAAVQHTVRLTHFVEVMTPILHTEAVRRYMRHFEGLTHGWGLDGLWSHDSYKTGRLLGVVDAAQAIHTRRTGKSSLYARIGGKKQAATDMRLLLEANKVDPKWVKAAMVEAPAPGRLLCLAPKRGSVLLRVDSGPAAAAAGGGLRAGAAAAPAASGVGAATATATTAAAAEPVVTAPEHGIAALAAGASGLAPGFHALPWPPKAGATRACLATAHDLLWAPPLH